jgi:hypothetical protein
VGEEISVSFPEGGGDPMEDLNLEVDPGSSGLGSGGISSLLPQYLFRYPFLCINMTLI